MEAPLTLATCPGSPARRRVTSCTSTDATPPVAREPADAGVSGPAVSTAPDSSATAAATAYRL